jgi:hypothetical protein
MPLYSLANVNNTHLVFRDLQSIRKQVEKVTFTMGRQSYTRDSVDAVQLLHYKTVDSESMTSVSVTNPESLVSMESADLVIFYATSARNDVTRTILHCELSRA